MTVSALPDGQGASVPELEENTAVLGLNADCTQPHFEFLRMIGRQLAHVILPVSETF